MAISNEPYILYFHINLRKAVYLGPVLQTDFLPKTKIQSLL